MSSKKKKLIIAANAGIISALREAYDLVNEGGHLPEIEDLALPSVANHIVKAMALQLTEIEENERFEGLSYEEIVEKKQELRVQELKDLQNKAGELLKSLRNPEPEITDEDPDGEDDDLDSDNLDEGLDEESDVDNDELDEESDDADHDQDNDSQDDKSENENPDVPPVLPVTPEQSQTQPSTPEKATVKELTTLYNKETKALAKLDVESVEFKNKQSELSELQARINQLLATT